ncbi:hypothetical protein Pcinc_030357 [Petrolisthes cinctipes]|uniref:CCHC-type domain-containing protein n=1 Tax=Petrolisthes cinctipes TaxID=88211 RepID=A0AAE1EYK3_PETCI|nr:hypothetical protein Pcinc_030357 [Petrolisthes cinctipes]
MNISQILNRARAMLVEEDAGTVLAGVEGATNVTCRKCGQPNHYARDCLMRPEWRNEGSRGRRGRLDIKFVTSAENKADVLTRVPKKWLSPGSQLVCGVVASVPKNEISKIHITSGHPGIKRTLYFCRRLFPSTTKNQNIEVDGIPRHVRDLRAVAPESIAMEGGNEQPDYEDSWDVEPDESLVVHQPVNVGELRGLDVEGSSSESEGSDTRRPLPHRGSRERRPARLFQYNDLP